MRKLPGPSKRLFIEGNRLTKRRGDLRDCAGFTGAPSVAAAKNQHLYVRVADSLQQRGIDTTESTDLTAFLLELPHERNEVMFILRRQLTLQDYIEELHCIFERETPAVVHVRGAVFYAA
jgi:hypothetical protein